MTRFEEFLGVVWISILVPLAWIAGALLLGLAVYAVFFRILAAWGYTKGAVLRDALVEHARGPLRWFFPLVAVGFAIPFLDLGPDTQELVKRVHGLLIVAVSAWVVIAGLKVVERTLLARYEGKTSDPKARAVTTQVKVFKDVAFFVVVLLAISLVLMSFEEVRRVGVSLLASAGVAGIIIGFAAQRSIGTLIAGIQVAISQPIRIGDTVVLEGEFGTVEEITLTYVVVRIWDLRRLVVPVTYFLERPFQNWTRVTPELLGSIHLHVDYSIPLESIRGEFERILEASRDLWDGRVKGLQVVDLKEGTVELRALMSAPDAGRAWDLRCRVRERILVYLRENHPEALPRIRAELERVPEGAA